MSRVLLLGLRITPIRRLMGRLRWPRPEHLSRLSDAEFEAYIRAIGGQAEAEAALAQHRGDTDQRAAIGSLRNPEGGGGQPAGAPVP